MSRAVWVYVATGVALWLIPVFDRLHVESGAVVAAVAFFTAGCSAARGGRPRTGQALRRQVLLPLIPAGMLLVAILWAPNCDIVRGGGLFAVFVWPSVFLGFAVGLAADAWSNRPCLWVVVTGVVIMLLGPVFDLGFHPQFYTYNHVFGGVLGPLYDEELVVRPGFFVFRFMTLLWALLLMCTLRRQWLWASGLVVVLAGMYAQSGRVGINTPERYLETQFSGRVQTDEFTIHFDTLAVSGVDLTRIVDDHAWYYERLRRLTGTAPAGRTISWIYADDDMRARLTGARRTSVAPVWLSTPQVHVSLASFHDVFPHELAHVFSREFGLPVLRASPLVGLVEGFAVAMEAPDGRPTASEQVLAVHADSTSRSRAAEQVAGALSGTGFWGGRAGVSYTYMGAFVRYLIDAFGMERFKALYRSGRFEAVYGMPVEHLARNWAQSLGEMHTALPVDAHRRAVRRFSVPSLFEQYCPHWVSPESRELRRLLGDVAAATDSTEGLVNLLERVPSAYRRVDWHTLSGLQATHSSDTTAAILHFRTALQESTISDRQARAQVIRAWNALIPCSGGLSRGHRAPGPGLCMELDRYDAWAGMMAAYEAGDPGEAIVVGTALRRAAHEAGDLQLVELLDDWLARLEW